MAHLVGSFVACGGAYKSLEDCYADVRDAQAYLSEGGRGAFGRAAALGGGERWGTEAKRIKVAFPDGSRPALIDRDLEEHNLAEVVNQCATMERLLDALLWAQDEPSLRGYAVERCHPTTGSSKGESEDHDLVLAREDEPEIKARFEVSDVVGAKDGNSKEKKDLASLGVLKKGSFGSVDEWPTGRLFLVVSEEFGGWLMRRRTRTPSYCYEEAGDVGTTRIFEVKEEAAR